MRDPSRQTAPVPGYSGDDSALADDLETVMADGMYDLPAIVAALNARPGPAGADWTTSTLAARLAALAEA